MMISVKSIVAAALLMASCGYCPIASAAPGALGLGYDWTVRITTSELNNCLQYSQSHMNPVDRLDVDYYAKDDDKSARPYEKFWYHDGKPLAMERLDKLGVQPGAGICVRVVHKNAQAQPAELTAAANAIMRLWVDAQVRKINLIAVRVPSSSFSQIVGRMEALNCQPVPDTGNIEQAQDVTMALVVETDAEDQKIKLCYK